MGRAGIFVTQYLNFWWSSYVPSNSIWIKGRKDSLPIVAEIDAFSLPSQYFTVSLNNSNGIIDTDKFKVPLNRIRSDSLSKGLDWQKYLMGRLHANKSARTSFLIVIIIYFKCWWGGPNEHRGAAYVCTNGILLCGSKVKANTNGVIGH